MIFVTVGTTRNPFDRLVEAVDDLARRGVLTDVFAQTGASTVTPRHCEHAPYLTPTAFREHLSRAELAIVHAGTGTVEAALALRKKVIVVPRQQGFGEHPDDHQLELARYLEARNRALCVFRIEDLEAQVRRAVHWTPTFRTPGSPSAIKEAIRTFVEKAADGS